MATLAPGKGGHFTLNQEVLRFFNDALDEISALGGDTLDQIIDDEECKELQDDLVSEYGWTATKDKFGRKVYKELEFGESGTYRVTLVLNSRGELKLDIRQWYDPTA